jgi:hypothetical protein
LLVRKEISLTTIVAGHLSGLGSVGCGEGMRNIGIIDDLFELEATGGPRFSFVENNFPGSDLFDLHTRLKEFLWVQTVPERRWIKGFHLESKKKVLCFLRERREWKGELELEVLL